MYIMRNIFKILHMCLNDESSQKGKIWMLRIIHFNEAPWILSASKFLPSNLLNIDIFLSLKCMKWSFFQIVAWYFQWQNTSTTWVADTTAKGIEFLRVRSWSWKSSSSSESQSGNWYISMSLSSISLLMFAFNLSN